MRIVRGNGARNHPQNPAAEEGYIHSVGHGLGLNVHEKPWLGRQPDPANVLRIGSVFTLEPGLYYPSKGYGIRIEDTWFVNEDGSFEKFVDYPMELVVPMRGGKEEKRIIFEFLVSKAPVMKPLRRSSKRTRHQSSVNTSHVDLHAQFGGVLP